MVSNQSRKRLYVRTVPPGARVVLDGKVFDAAGVLTPAVAGAVGADPVTRVPATSGVAERHTVTFGNVAPQAGYTYALTIDGFRYAVTGKSTWTHNQALMELGALVCSARAPKCPACPVKRVCASYPITPP
jgi:hypothetical protein